MKWLRWFHLARLAGWTILTPIALTTGLKDSLPFVVFLSLAALIEGAFAAYMGARAEKATS